MKTTFCADANYVSHQDHSLRCCNLWCESMYRLPVTWNISSLPVFHKILEGKLIGDGIHNKVLKGYFSY